MGFGSLKSNNPFRHSSSSNNNNHNNHNNDIDNVPPPPGPPPSYRPAAASGAGPPPPSEQQYAPPPGPPPSYGTGKGGGRGEKNEFDNDDDFAPPPGPPPPQQQQQQPQHDWEQAVPDTSLFPPPPDIFSGWDRSPANNATEEQAEAGEAWCRSYPLSPPTDLHGAGADPGLMRAGIVPRLIAPPPGVFGNKGGSLAEKSPGAPGTWAVRTGRRAGDCCLIGYPHAYLVQRDSPLATGRAKTVYFECRVGTQLGEHAGLAVGFQALPYPPFRMPGWHRGSLAVHGDDGHKYVNDRWGGKDFTGPFGKGEVVGIGMVLSPVGGVTGDGDGDSKGKGKGKGAEGIQVEVFFTRGGREVGRWDMHESLDFEKDLPITGLEGFHDLTVAIGTYGAVTAEVVLDPSRWLFKP